MNDYQQAIEKSFDSYIKHLDRLIRIPSVWVEGEEGDTPFGENIQKSLEEMITICQEIGFNTFIDPDGYYGYADAGEGALILGVLGHLDVVPAGDLSNWSSPPFEPRIEDGKYYGRGSQDDKGPMLAAIYALKNLLDSGLKLQGRIRFIFGTDEESLWRGIKRYTEKEEVPSIGFTPDSRFPLIYAEKGLLQIKLCANNEAGVLFKAGDAYNAVPSTITAPASMTIKKYLDTLGYEFKDLGEEVEVAGKSAHAQVAETGINAINRYLHALYEAGIPSKSAKFIVENIIGHDFAEPIFGEVKDEHSGSLKFNVGKCDFNDDEEILCIDIRIPVTYDKKIIEQKLKNKAEEYGLSYEEYDYMPSIYVPKDSTLITTLMSAYQEETADFESKPTSSGGATYARAIPNCVAFGAVLPNSEKTEHQPNEYIILEDIKTAMRIYMKAFEKLNKQNC
ncbi:MAG: Sapep family Mn(2+)-dependent dipeptidase [Brevinema sp.]